MCWGGCTGSTQKELWGTMAWKEIEAEARGFGERVVGRGSEEHGEELRRGKE